MWESVDIDEGVHEDDVNEHIEKYCRNNDKQMILAATESVADFIKSQVCRYEVNMYECDDNDNLKKETGKHFSTDNLKLALSKSATFYRSAKNPRVNIIDNETNQYIAEWD